MKKLTLLIIILLSYIEVGNAQSSNSDFNYNTENYKNEISFEALQLINGVYQMSYERYIWNNFSAALAVGYKGKKGLVKISGIDGEKIKTDEIYYSGYQIIPEIRYYIKKTTLRNLTGFYVGAYLKYNNYSSDLNGSYTSSENIEYALRFDSKISITSAGLMVGYKLPISKHFNIDFIIAGPGSGHYKFKLKNQKDLPDEFYDDLNNALEKYNLLDLINSNFRFSEVNNTSKFTALSFRYGIALCYTF
ncbi:DUF3575 domain-containing protein [Formosa sp. S-31]|uniref:DUF3575 domain-containing protein n=1 Tax=Formosa sp. S-31 TaxID=2790949 RepID=UPI003EBD0CE5